MNNLNPLIFLTPVIALILVVLLITYWRKKVNNKAVFYQFVIIILVVAFLLNFSWEVIQMPLYQKAPYTAEHIAFCALASIADAIMVLLIYLGLVLIYQQPNWVKELSISRILVLMLTGGIGAIIAEMAHVSAGNWAYDNSMPIIPFVNVGLSPVLQFTFLPICVYYLALKIKNSKELTGLKLKQTL